MKMTKFLVFSLSALVLLAGCSSEIFEEEVRGGTLQLRTVSEGIASLDPQRVYSDRDVAILSTYLHRTLVTYDMKPGGAGSVLVPDLATDVGRPQNQFKTWTFTLKDGVVFETGQAITCYEIKYAVSRSFATVAITGGQPYARRYLDIPMKKNGQSKYLGPYKAKAENQALFDNAVECSADGKEITFFLKQSMPDFNYVVASLAFAPVPLDEGGNPGSGYEQKPVASGPYRYSDASTQDKLLLIRNLKWTNDDVRRALPDQIMISSNLTENETITEINDGINLGNDAVNLDKLGDTDLLRIFNDPAFETQRLNDVENSMSAVMFNLETVTCAPLRKSLYFALNRNELVNKDKGSIFGPELITSLLTPSLFPNYSSPVTGLEDLLDTGNKDRAEAFLFEAKSQCPAVYKQASTKELGLSMLVWDDDSAIAQAESISKAAKKVGIYVSVKVVNTQAYYANLRNPKKRSDLYMLILTPEWLHPASLAREFLLPGGLRQFMASGSSEEFQPLLSSINEALVIEGETEQRDAWVVINQQLTDKAFVLPLFQYRTQYFWGSNVTPVGMWSAFSVPLFNDLGLKVVVSEIE